MCAQATSQPPPTAAAAAEGLTGQQGRPCSPPPPGGATRGPARPHPPGPPRQTAGRGRRSADSSRADGSGSPQWPRGARVAGRAARSLAGARLEAGAAASRPRGDRRGGAGPGPWAPQDARTEPAPGTSNDKPPALPAPRRTSSGRGTTAARKTRSGAATRDRPPQPALRTKGRPKNPGWSFYP